MSNFKKMHTFKLNFMFFSLILNMEWQNIKLDVVFFDHSSGESGSWLLGALNGLPGLFYVCSLGHDECH